ncbi:hypothetical protein FRX31_009920, partial [Thalictrum thalictroides]
SQDIVWSGLREICTAKIVPHTSILAHILDFQHARPGGSIYEFRFRCAEFRCHEGFSEFCLFLGCKYVLKPHWFHMTGSSSSQREIDVGIDGHCREVRRRPSEGFGRGTEIICGGNALEFYSAVRLKTARKELIQKEDEIAEILEMACQQGVISKRESGYCIEGEILKDKYEAERYLSEYHEIRGTVVKDSEKPDV